MFRTHNRHNKIEQDNSCSYIQRGAKRQKEIECPHPTLRLVKNTRYGPSDRIRTCGILLPKQARYHLRYTRLFGFYPAGRIHPKQPRDHRCRSPAFLRPCASCSVAGSPISIMDCRGKVNLRLPLHPRAEKQNPPPAAMECLAALCFTLFLYNFFMKKPNGFYKYHTEQ